MRKFIVLSVVLCLAGFVHASVVVIDSFDVGSAALYSSPDSAGPSILVTFS